MFGALDMPGDVIVVVRGPLQRQIVRRKSRVSGIWLNTSAATFGNVPAFYAVAANRPLVDIADAKVRAREEWVGIPAFWPGTGKRHHGRENWPSFTAAIAISAAPVSIGRPFIPSKFSATNCSEPRFGSPPMSPRGPIELLCTWSIRGGWWPKNR